MKEWWMTSGNHWVRVREVAVKSRLLRASGRVGGGEKVGGGFKGKGRRGGRGRVGEQVQKSFRVEFEPLQHEVRRRSRALLGSARSGIVVGHLTSDAL